MLECCVSGMCILFIRIPASTVRGKGTKTWVEQNKNLLKVRFSKILVDCDMSQIIEVASSVSVHP